MRKNLDQFLTKINFEPNFYILEIILRIGAAFCNINELNTFPKF